MTSSKYSGSHNRQLDINPVEKEDEGKCQAFFSRGSNRKIHKILSKGPFLQKTSKCQTKKVTYRVIIISRDDFVFVELVGTYHPRFQIFHEYINGELMSFLLFQMKENKQNYVFTNLYNLRNPGKLAPSKFNDSTVDNLFFYLQIKMQSLVV